MNARSLFGTLSLLAVAAGCGPSEPAAGGTDAQGLSGSIAIDGSSTVSPIMEAIAEEFQRKHSQVRPTVATSGTGGGFKKFINGEIDICNASRPIRDEELAQLKAKGVEFVELPVAFDGLSVVVNPANDFVDSITVAELKKIWDEGSKVTTWADVRAGWPAEKIKLYGPGTDSGTFDYFSEAINGKAKRHRSEYQQSEDDNTLVQGVAGDKFALGYFGYSYYEQNRDKLKLAQVEGVTPSPETIATGAYKPLSRPLLIYVSRKALDRPEVASLVKFLVEEGKALISEVGYVPLGEEDYQAVSRRLEAKTTGSAFANAEAGLKIAEILGREKQESK